MEAYLFAIFIFVMIGETALSLTWSRTYFRFGFVIFRCIRHVSTSSTVPTANVVSLRIPESTYPALVFRNIGDDAYGFRERLFQFGKMGYSAVMRGVLTFDQTRRQVTVDGYLNWFTPVFFVVMLSFMINLAAPIPVAILFIGAAAGIVGWIYRLQSRRFAEVAEIAAATWEAST